MFTEHKISAFAQKIADLPDMPNMQPNDLKARFDACPEELRASLNGVCDDGAALNEKVEEIVAQTYGGTIHETMLDTPLAEKINGKAEQTALDAVSEATADSIAAEQTAREAADTAEAAAREAADTAEAAAREAADTALQTLIEGKCRAVSGFYTGNDATSRHINLPFAPIAVLLTSRTAKFYIANDGTYGGLAVPNCELRTIDGQTAMVVDSSGFTIYFGGKCMTNSSSQTYCYLAIG